MKVPTFLLYIWRSDLFIWKCGLIRGRYTCNMMYMGYVLTGWLWCLIYSVHDVFPGRVLHLWQLLTIMDRDEQTFVKFGSAGLQNFGKKFGCYQISLNRTLFSLNRKGLSLARSTLPFLLSVFLFRSGAEKLKWIDRVGSAALQTAAVPDGSYGIRQGAAAVYDEQYQ